MTERAKREMAWLLAEGSEVFDFDTALELVQRRPAEAENLLREREKWRVLMNELTRANERLRLAAREFR
jgi:hypothetical protein